MEVLKNWQGCKHPERKVFEGNYVRLEPLNTEIHLEEFYEFSSGPDAEKRMEYIFQYPTSKEALKNWMLKLETRPDGVAFAVRDKSTGKVGGRQALIHIDEAHGVAEMGEVLWGPLISRRAAGTEALYLIAKHLFEDLGYRRFEWKCHHANASSSNAALRFGFKFEGIFRQHFVMKGANRDSCWFSIIDKEWHELKVSYEKWLSPDNFDENGMQKQRLMDFR